MSLYQALIPVLSSPLLMISGMYCSVWLALKFLAACLTKGPQRQPGPRVPATNITSWSSSGGAFLLKGTGRSGLNTSLVWWSVLLRSIGAERRSCCGLGLIHLSCTRIQAGCFMCPTETHTLHQQQLPVTKKTERDAGGARVTCFSLYKTTDPVVL